MSEVHVIGSTLQDQSFNIVYAELVKFKLTASQDVSRDFYVTRKNLAVIPGVKFNEGRQIFLL